MAQARTAPRSKGRGKNDTDVLGRVAEAMSPDDLLGSLDRALDILLRDLGGDDAEIFLVEPESGALLLVACQGADRTALLSRTLFEPGVGHPGIVTATRRSIVTRNLVRDQRFLRSDLKRRGVRAYVSVPLLAGAQVLGSIHMGWHRADAPLDRARTLLERACVPIGTAVRAGIGALRDAALADLEDDDPTTPNERALRSILAFMQRIAKSDAVTLLTTGSPCGHTLSARKPVVCAGDLAGCPSLGAGRPRVLEERRDAWPAPCRQLPLLTKAAVCLPLLSKGDRRGIIVVAHDSPIPTPATRLVAPLMAMARAVAARLPSPRLPVPVEENGSPSLSIRCFGSFEIRRDGRVIAGDSFERRLAIKLLEMLVLAGGTPLHRDVLVEKLWPDSPGHAGVNRLHGVVHSLRATIEPRSATRDWRYVRNAGPMYRLDASNGVHVDLFQFREKIAHARCLPARATTELIATLQGAVSLYGGGLFADDPYADWCAAERDALQEQFLCATADLARLLVAASEPERAIETLRNGLRVDPLREDLHEALIKIMLQVGRRAEAEAQYHECVRLLRNGLGAEPLPETLELRSLIDRALRPGS